MLPYSYFCCLIIFVEWIEDFLLLLRKIDFYFTEWTPKVVFSRVVEPQVKIPLLVIMSEIKIDLTLKKSNFLFLLCFKIAKIKFIPMRQQSRQRNSFLSSRFMSNLMLPACLLGMILVVNKGCNWKIAWNFCAKQISRHRTRKNA